MTDAGRFPNLVERALRFLSGRPDAAEAELCAHLFGASGIGPWSRLLAQVLAAEERVVRRPDGHWCLRATTDAEPVGMLATEFVAIAVVAAGAKPWRHPLLGVAALRFRAADPASAAIWQTVVNPGRQIRLPDYVVAKGIAEEEVAAAPTFAAVASDLLSFIGDRPLVGLDVGLAAAWIQQALREIGRPPLTNPLIDIVSLARLALGDAIDGKPDAARLAAAAGIPLSDERRFDSGARNVARITTALIPRLPAALVTPDELLAALGGADSGGLIVGLDATRRRLLLDATLASDLPAGPGVYLFRDEAGRVLYVGKATSLRRRLTSYLTSDVGRTRRMPGLVESTDEIEVRPAATELEARLLEARLIAAEAPRYNTQARAGVELAYLQREPGAAAPRAKGDPRRPAWATISSTAVVDAGDGRIEGEVIGPLAADEARRLLRDATDRFQLSGKKRDAAWSARADAAWREVVAASAATTVGGRLHAGELALFAILAPWPLADIASELGEVTTFRSVTPREERVDDRIWPARLPTDDLRSDDLGDNDTLADWSADAEDWAEINQDWRAEAAERAAESAPDEDAETPTRGPNWLLDGAIRAVVCGGGGYLDGLTIAAGSTVESVAADLSTLAAREATSPTALGELGVALAEANRRSGARPGDTVVSLGGSYEEAAARLLAERARLAGLEG